MTLAESVRRAGVVGAGGGGFPAAAMEGVAVTHKTLTVAGAVWEPATLTVPIGTPLRECLDAAGGLSVEDVVLCVGGLMMGEVTEDAGGDLTRRAG